MKKILIVLLGVILVYFCVMWKYMNQIIPETITDKAKTVLSEKENRAKEEFKEMENKIESQDKEIKRLTEILKKNNIEVVKIESKTKQSNQGGLMCFLVIEMILSIFLFSR